MRVVRGPSANRPGTDRVVRIMDRIDEQHMSEPGLMVLDITAGDETTVRAAMAELDRRWAISGTTLRRVPGEPGVRARLYADLRRHPPATSEPTL